MSTMGGALTTNGQGASNRATAGRVPRNKAASATIPEAEKARMERLIHDLAPRNKAEERQIRADLHRDYLDRTARRAQGRGLYEEPKYTQSKAATSRAAKLHGAMLEAFRGRDAAEAMPTPKEQAAFEKLQKSFLDDLSRLDWGKRYEAQLTAEQRPTYERNRARIQQRVDTFRAMREAQQERMRPHEANINTTREALVAHAARSAALAPIARLEAKWTAARDSAYANARRYMSAPSRAWQAQVTAAQERRDALDEQVRDAKIAFRSIYHVDYTEAKAYAERQKTQKTQNASQKAEG